MKYDAGGCVRSGLRLLIDGFELKSGLQAALKLQLGREIPKLAQRRLRDLSRTTSGEIAGSKYWCSPAQMAHDHTIDYNGYPEPLCRDEYGGC
jgi:hypothetical protein